MAGKVIKTGCFKLLNSMLRACFSLTVEQSEYFEF